ncbi:MAG: response regulator [Candidatus Cloacimonetes bacterium]|nr:response regulator [Candidatus Cloacimonadota bacterium]
MEKKKILIVEDEKVIAQDIKNSLKAYKYSISAIVSSGEEALENIEKLKPDLIIMDIVLSGDLTGVEAAEQIKEKFGTPIIFLTAYADEDTLEGAIAADPYGYLVKPVREKDIIAAVKTAFHMIQRETNSK